MFKPKWVGWLIFLSLILPACGTAAPGLNPTLEPGKPQETSPASQPTQATETATPLPAAAEEARKFVAGELGLAQDQVKVLAAETVNWPDTCLGAPKPNEDCTVAQTPGYIIRLEAGGKTVEIHSNQTGSELRKALAEGTQDDSSRKAIGLLAKLAGLKTAETRVTRMEARDWPDACLGVPNLGEVCAAVITPGYYFELQNGNDVYWLDTNQKISDGRVAGPQNTLIGMRVRLQAAKIANLPVENLKIASLESVEWPNSCLGINTPGVMCLDVITPGYKAVVMEGARRLIFHTNHDATSVVIEK